MKKTRFFESLDNSVSILTSALTKIIEEWSIVKQDFTLIDEDEIADAASLINSNIDSISEDNILDIIEKLEQNSDLDIFDDISFDSKNLVLDCFILNSVLTRDEKLAIAFNSEHVTIKAFRENGRDLIRIKINLVK